MDAFFASVEQRDNPDLRGKPVIVGGAPAQRGVVAACSYEARNFGIHSAMPSSRAIKLCPQAIFLPPRFSAYKAASEKIHTIFKRYTHLIEPLSLDEAYLDVSASELCEGLATKIAFEIKRSIQQELGLTASAGVSYNKFLAKIASDIDKPDGLFVIRPDQAELFIDKLAVGKFFGVGRVTEQKMHKLGIFSGADLKRYNLAELKQHFGKAGIYYHNIARGIDDRPVRVNRERKSIGKETTFSKDLIEKKKIWTVLKNLTENVVQLLNQRELNARTIVLKVRYNNFKLITRSMTLPAPISNSDDVLVVLPILLKKTAVGKTPIRLVGISLTNLNSSSSLTVNPKHSSNETECSDTRNENKREQHALHQLGLFS